VLPPTCVLQEVWNIFLNRSKVSCENPNMKAEVLLFVNCSNRSKVSCENPNMKAEVLFFVNCS